MKELINFLKLNKSQFYLSILYILLFAGGLWNVLGVFSSILPLLSSPFVISIGIISIILFFKSIKISFVNALILLIVFVSSIYAEYIGVSTSILFGNYSYTNVLYPHILGVPFAIGFAWISTLFASLGVIYLLINIIEKRLNYNILTKLKLDNSNFSFISVIFIAILNGSLMTIFDFIMEPAAIKLNYWFWLENDNIYNIPFKNYLSWFGLGTIFSFLILFANKSKIELLLNQNNYFHHLYFAQLIYFIMIYFS